MGIPLDKIAPPSSHNAWNPEVGDSISGEITFMKIMPPKDNFDGDKREQELRLDLVTEDGEQVTVWAVVNTDVDGDGYPSRLARAISDAVRDADATELELGGKLALARIEDVAPSKKGRFPAKAFDGAYRAPKARLAIVPDDDEEGEEPPVPAATAKPRPSAADLLGD